MTVEQKQILLAFLGYLPTEKIDGVWGPVTAEATGAFQSAYDLEPDKVFGPMTEARIREIIGNSSEPQHSPETIEPGTFWDHIRYWTREEFACRCGEYHKPYCNGFPVEPDQTLVELVDDIRHRAEAPGHRSSGIRCAQHNVDSGGVANSKHRFGKALDFFVEGYSSNRLLNLIKGMHDTRLNYVYAIDDHYVHVDVK